MSEFFYADRVKVFSTGTGVADFVLGSAFDGTFQTFAAAGAVNGSKVRYGIRHVTAAEIEIGEGTIGASGELKRDLAVRMSSNGNALVSFSAGNKIVWLDHNAADITGLARQGEANVFTSAQTIQVPTGEVVVIDSTAAGVASGSISSSGIVGQHGMMFGSNLKFNSAGIETRYNAAESGMAWEFFQDFAWTTHMTAAGLLRNPININMHPSVPGGRVDFQDAYLSTTKKTAPDDASVLTSGVILYWQDTIGSAKPLFKGKDSAGTPVNFTPISSTEGDATYAQLAAANTFTVGPQTINNQAGWSSGDKSFVVQNGGGDVITFDHDGGGMRRLWFSLDGTISVGSGRQITLSTRGSGGFLGIYDSIVRHVSGSNSCFHSDRSSSKVAVGVVDLSPTLNANFTVFIGSASMIGQIVKGAASQSANLQEWQDSTGAIGARIDSSRNFSRPNGSGSEQFGASAVASGTASTAIGNSATTGAQLDATAVGQAASVTGQGGDAFGKLATAATQGAAIGSGANAGSYCVSFGSNSNTSGRTGSIALGIAATATADNQCVIGADGIIRIETVYIGEGVTNPSPVAVAINATGGSGSNIAGADIKIAGGKGTGDATPGRVVLQVSVPGASGATLQSLADAAAGSYTATAGETRFMLYDVDTATLKRVKVGANNSGPGGAGRALYIDNS